MGNIKAGGPVQQKIQNNPTITRPKEKMSRSDYLLEEFGSKILQNEEKSVFFHKKSVQPTIFCFEYIMNLY